MLRLHCGQYSRVPGSGGFWFSAAFYTAAPLREAEPYLLDCLADDLCDVRAAAPLRSVAKNPAVLSSRSHRGACAAAPCGDLGGAVNSTTTTRSLRGFTLRLYCGTDNAEWAQYAESCLRGLDAAAPLRTLLVVERTPPRQPSPKLSRRGPIAETFAPSSGGNAGAVSAASIPRLHCGEQFAVKKTELGVSPRLPCAAPLRLLDVLAQHDLDRVRSPRRSSCGSIAPSRRGRSARPAWHFRGFLAEAPLRQHSLAELVVGALRVSAAFSRGSIAATTSSLPT